jgi:hypothetical protein
MSAAPVEADLSGTDTAAPPSESLEQRRARLAVELRATRIVKIIALALASASILAVPLLASSPWYLLVPDILVALGFIVWLWLTWHETWGVVLRRPGLLRKVLVEALGQSSIERAYGLLEAIDPSWTPATGPERSRVLIARHDVAGLRADGAASVEGITKACTTERPKPELLAHYADILAEFGGEDACGFVPDQFQTTFSGDLTRPPGSSIPGQYYYRMRKESYAWFRIAAALRAHGRAWDRALGKLADDPLVALRLAVPHLFFEVGTEEPQRYTATPEAIGAALSALDQELAIFPPELRRWILYEVRVAFARDVANYVSLRFERSGSTTTTFSVNVALREHWRTNLEAVLFGRKYFGRGTASQIDAPAAPASAPLTAFLEPDVIRVRIAGELLETGWPKLRSQVARSSDLERVLEGMDFDASHSLLFPMPPRLRELDRKLRAIFTGAAPLPGALAPLERIRPLVTLYRPVAWLPPGALSTGAEAGESEVLYVAVHTEPAWLFLPFDLKTTVLSGEVIRIAQPIGTDDVRAFVAILAHLGSANPEKEAVELALALLQKMA